MVTTPLGKSFVTVNENGGHQPFEVFITTAKAGSETAAISEAIGRLISYILRLASPVAPRDRLQEVIRQLERHRHRPRHRLRPQPRGLAARWRGPRPGRIPGRLEPTERARRARQRPPMAAPAGPGPNQMALKIGDICPECGEATLVNEEGCRKCYSCSFSQC